jgi:DNA invertase Pin-like site-specific DNA recombinase
VEDTPTATLVRQVLGAVAQFDKAMTVAKLRIARDRVRQRNGKCEGRKSHLEERPEVVDLAKRRHKQGLSYRAIGAELERAGHVNERGKPFHHKSVRNAQLIGDQHAELWLELER